MNIRLLVAAFAGFAIAASNVSAQTTNNDGIYAAASQYRNAVIQFENVVKRIRGINRTDERLVDKFEEATKQLRLAARNPRHSTRLRNEWRTIQPMQFKVESTIFGKYTLHHDLVRAWENVLYAQAIFEDEYVFQFENPRHGNRVSRRVVRANPSRFFPPPPASSGRIYNPQ